MQEYNTALESVKLPEYGRNVQKLVEYCMTIEDRQKRNQYAHLIIGIMADLCPEACQVENYSHILWDHLAMISDFKLDIDYPCEIIRKDYLNTPPETIGYDTSSIKYRMYGKKIEEMIRKACELEDKEQRIRLFELCANQMKLYYHKTNNEAQEDDNKIIQDLLEYTHGEFRDEIYQVFLFSVKELMVNTQYNPQALVTPTKKKKKKKK